MKAREGFVSNSSSTSFIVAVKDEPEKCPRCGRGDPDILDLIESRSNYSCDNEVDARGFDGIKEDLQDWFWGDDNKQKEVLKKAEEYDGKEGWELASISISYHDELLRDAVENMIEAGNMVVFYRGD